MNIIASEKSLRTALRMTYCFCERAILSEVILVKKKEERKEKALFYVALPKNAAWQSKSSSSKAALFESSFISTMCRSTRHNI